MVQNGNGNYMNVPAVKGFPNLLQYPIKIMLQVEVEVPCNDYTCYLPKIVHTGKMLSVMTVQS